MHDGQEGCTLLVKHFDPQWSDDAKRLLLHQVGAVQITCNPSYSRLRHSCYATFATAQAAAAAMHALHQRPCASRRPLAVRRGG